MSVFAVSMWRNEADIGPTNIRHLLAEGIDHIIVADNMSTDGTADHLHDFITNGAPVSYVYDGDLAYQQARKMTKLMHMAGAMGADWIVPFDADELWYSPHSRLADVLRHANEHVQWAEGFYHVPHVDDDESEPDPVLRMRHRRVGRDCPQAKVCFRYNPEICLHMGNHDVDGVSALRGRGLIAFREFQYRSFEHFVAKLRHGKAAYDATDLPADCGIHWRRLGAMSDNELAVEWAKYLATPTEYDPAPLRTTERVG